MTDAPTAPPPRSSEPGRVYMLRDLPLDVLSLILSFIPDFEERFKHPRWACRELAAASAPPSVAWGDVSLLVPSPWSFAKDINTANAAQLAATAVRRVSLKELDFMGLEDCPENPLPLFVPYMEELVLENGHCCDQGFRVAKSWLTPLLAAATRLTRLEFFDDPAPLVVEGPPGVIAGWHEALADFARGAATFDFDADPFLYCLDAYHYRSDTRAPPGPHCGGGRRGPPGAADAAGESVLE